MSSPKLKAETCPTQVKTWPAPALKKFWEKWYFPANVTLYVVGDLDRDVDEVKALIQKTFGKLSPAQVKVGP